MSVALLMNALVYASMLVLMAQAHTLTYLTSGAFNQASRESTGLPAQIINTEPPRFELHT